MAAPKGNQFYKNVEFPGAPPKFKTPEALWLACKKYFEDADGRRVHKNVVKTAGGKIKIVPVEQSVPYSLGRLQLHIGIFPNTWRNWKNKEGDHFREDLLPVIEWAELVIREQQLEGASTNMFNANIMSRVLGLVDRQAIENQHSGKVENPIQNAENFANELLKAHGVEPIEPDVEQAEEPSEEAEGQEDIQ